MATPIRVLIVEDSVDDAELEIWQLRRAGYEPTWQRVETAQEFLDALDEPYDLILADYRLPAFTGLDALGLLRAQGRTIPFILISGALGEEYAVECIKQGASDYLLKGRLARLGPAVERALQESAVLRAKAEVEEALRQSEAHYRAIVDIPVNLICRWLPDGRLTYTNDAYAAMFGRRPADLVGCNWADLVAQSDRREVEETYVDIRENPQVATVEHAVIDGEGRRRLIVWTDYPIFDAGGQVVEFQSVGQDVTELRRVEQQIHLLSQAVEQSPVSIIITDRDGVINYVNPHCLVATGFAESELLGHTPAVLKSGNMPPEIYRHLWQTILDGKRWCGELQNRRKDGLLVWANVQISPIIDNTGALTHFVCVQEDITERKLREAELRRLNEQLELRVEERTVELRSLNLALQRAAQAKDEFLASMSHELRTPLTGILGISEGLADGIYGQLNERQMRALSTVRASGEHLLGLINDILDVAKSEAGLMQPQFESLSVDDVCQASLNLIRGLAQQKHQRVAYSISPAVITLQADVRRIKQMLVNLLSNAVKFTPHDGQIGLEVIADAGGQNIRFCVWDTGIGIPSSDISRLFRPFTQLDASLAREYAGTGLGLALVRNMAELHGGSVAVESQVGQGSRFTVVLPWRRPPVGAARVEAVPVNRTGADLPAMTAGVEPLILLADDNETMLDVYKNYLQAGGCQVVTAQRGSEAVRLAETIHPALILMDIQMPGMDGLAAIRRLRSSSDASVASVPIVALTALAMPGDRDRCLAAGADDYLSKPVPLPKLVETIRNLLAGPRP